MSPAQRARRLQLLAIIAGALPAAFLGVGALTDGLGAEPIERVTHRTGEWALRFLLISLAVTPLRKLTGWSWLAPLRRTFGLTAFTYACFHFFTFLGLEHFFDWLAIAEDVLERRYITAGFAAFLCLLALAVTSTRAAIRRLGHRWTQLHRLVYLAAILGVVHFLWLVKKDLTDPLVYAGATAVLLGVRLWLRVRGGGRGDPRANLDLSEAPHG